MSNLDFSPATSPEDEYLLSISKVLTAAAVVADSFKAGHIYGLSELVEAVEKLRANDREGEEKK